MAKVGRRKGHKNVRPAKNSNVEKIIQAVDAGKYDGSKTELAEYCECSIGAVIHTFKRWLPEILDEEENARKAERKKSKRKSRRGK